MHPNVNEYFRTARERYAIAFRKNNRHPKPWTEDKPFLDWRFCNVHREDDKTTVWFRENVRQPLMQKSLYHQIMAAMIFRWFNRIETGERIKDLLLDDGPFNTAEARRRLTGINPIVTGAYIIKCGDGMSKLEGILSAIEGAESYMHLFNPKAKDFDTLQGAWTYLRNIDWMGPFMAYEVVSDLRWTPVLAEAKDILTWANPGPGCARGISRVLGRDKMALRAGSAKHREEMLRVMNWLLTMARDKEAGYWPAHWPEWEMREVEHWACEFDKYQRVSIDGDRMKQGYPGRQ